MLKNMLAIIFIMAISLTLILIGVGMLLSLKFQKRQQKKLKEVEDIVKSKQNVIFEFKSGLTNEELLRINPKLDINGLATCLFNTFKELELKIKNHDDSDLDKLVVGTTLNFIKSRIDTYKINGYFEVVDDIDLLEYAFVEYNKDSLKFRIKINCINYKKINNDIISGSEFKKLEEVLIISYKNISNNWLIEDIDKVLEKKMAE